MADARAQKKETETTESYRGELRPVTNVERVLVSANDNERESSRSAQRRAKYASFPRGRNRVESIARPSPVNNNKISANSWKLFAFSMSATAIAYKMQVFFGILCLIGFIVLSGLEDSAIFSAADIASFGSIENIGVGLFLLGGVGALLCGTITYLVALPIFTKAGKSTLGVMSPLVMVVCLVSLLCPVVNLFPMMWLWCLYVAIFN